MNRMMFELFLLKANLLPAPPHQSHYHNQPNQPAQAENDTIGVKIEHMVIYSRLKINLVHDNACICITLK